MTLPFPLDPAAVAAAFHGWDIDPEPLGEGTFKTAFHAIRDGQVLVLKVVREPVSEDAQEEEFESVPGRFAREILAMNRLESPRVVRLLDKPALARIGGQPRYWYTEPFYAGGSLAKRRTSQWAEPRVLDLMRDIGEGIAALAEAELVHRDIKPDNIVFDGQDRAVLLDLGIALHLRLDTLTSGEGPSPHTPAYAAPEQFAARKNTTIDFRTDLFQLGIVAFEALTGVHPFRPDRPDALDRILQAEFDVQALDLVAPSPALRAILQRLLGQRPNQRYRKVELLLDAIEECQI